MSRNQGKRTISQAAVSDFLKAQEQLGCFLTEVGKLSTKKPDGPLNKFKLKFINQVLETINAILGDDFRPFPEFTVFDVEGSVPSASDVVMMLSQYQSAMARFRSAHMVTVKKPEDDLLTLVSTTTAWNTESIKPEDLADFEEDEDES